MLGVSRAEPTTSSTCSVPDSGAPLHTSSAVGAHDNLKETFKMLTTRLEDQTMPLKCYNPDKIPVGISSGILS